LGLKTRRALSMRPLMLLALCIALPQAAFSQGTATPAPQNSHPKGYGTGWECDYGYREAAGSCVAIVIPSNGHSTDSAFGPGWDCDRGYRSVSGNCIAVKVPANAHLTDTSYGRNGWECDRSYQEQRGACVAVVVPRNAYPVDSSFGRGWECSRGFRATNESCVEVAVPVNGYLQRDGSSWSCERGFERIREACTPITVPEHGYQAKETPREVYRAGIKSLGNFAALAPAEQDQKLLAIEKSYFFRLLRQHTIEGMFSDPMHGGNAGMVGWQLIGYPGPLMSFRDEIEKAGGQPWVRKPQSLTQIAGRAVTVWEEEKD